MSLDAAEFGDVTFVERGFDVRIIVSIPGRYSLSDLRDVRGECPVFACRAISVSPSAIALTAPISGKVGKRVIAHFDHLGKLQGPIIRQLESGFMMDILASEEERERLAAKIEWLENFKNHDAEEQRTDARTVPANPYSKMIFSDGGVAACVVLDLSASGASISADTVPEIGTVLAIGTVVGRVLRHFVGGFAVQFIQRQDPNAVEAMLIPR